MPDMLVPEYEEVVKKLMELEKKRPTQLQKMYAERVT
jgi:hypothetical protein